MKKLNLLHLILFFCLWTSGYGQDFRQSAWHIQAEKIDPSNYFGITVANGMIGLVSSPVPMQVKDVVLNGTFDNYGRGRVSNILKGFNFANMYLDVDGQRIGAANISNYTQVLDMKHAMLTTSFEFQGKVKVSYTTMALRHLPYTALTDVEITALQPVEVSPASVIEAPDILRDVRNFYAEIDRPHVIIPLLTSVAASPSAKHTIAASNSFIFPKEEGHPRLIHEDWDYNMHLLKFRKKLGKGQKLSFSIVGSLISSQQVADPHNEAERLTIYAALEGRERLLQRHKAAWDQLWQSDIIIEGDLQSQRDIRSALYHLYAFTRAGTAYSPSPMGLSGLGYNGHVFWDTELWMYPPMLMLKPEIALSMLEYRYQRLDAARQNARNHGYKGAMFPWESADTGDEATPVWALTGPFQHHITGCVGFAFWKYYQVTNDKVWLHERGWPVLKEVADFWASRAEKGADGKYHILNVVCADEWAENVDDNAFTNGIAKEVLGYANEAARTLGLPENPDWKNVAEGLVILQFPDGTTREHATYKGEPIKQTDVNLLAYPLKQITEEATIRKDLDYYWKTLADNIPGRKGQSPAMAQAIFSILNTRLGDAEKGYSQFLDSYRPNRVPPFGVLAETAGGTNPYFATGAGGMLQAVLAGFGGLDIGKTGIVQLPTTLPKAWKSLTITGVGTENKTFTVMPKR